jgi:hypothetical protein
MNVRQYSVAGVLMMVACSLQAATQTLTVEVEYPLVRPGELTPTDSIGVIALWTGFHDGTFVTFQKAARAPDALRSYFNTGFVQPLKDALGAHQADAIAF